MQKRKENDLYFLVVLKKFCCNGKTVNETATHNGGSGEINRRQARKKQGVGGFTWLHPEFYSGFFYINSLFHAHTLNQSQQGLNFFFIYMQEAAVVPPYVALAVRPNPGFWEFVKVNANDLTVDSISASEYLKFKESIFDENW